MQDEVLIISIQGARKHNCSVIGFNITHNEYIELRSETGRFFTRRHHFEVGRVYLMELLQMNTDSRMYHIHKVLDFEPTDKFITNLYKWLLNRGQYWSGSPESCYDRLLRSSYNGSGYISIEQENFPSHSIGLWKPDRPLRLTLFRQKNRYFYLGVSRIKTIPVRTDEQPPYSLPMNSLILLSLAYFWKIPNAAVEERAYLVIKGWFEQ